MCLSRYPADLKRVRGNLLLQLLETWASEVEDVLLKNALERFMICVDCEEWKAAKIKRTLEGGPNNG